MCEIIVAALMHENQGSHCCRMSSLSLKTELLLSSCCLLQTHLRCPVPTTGVGKGTHNESLIKSRVHLQCCENGGDEDRESKSSS